MLKYQSSNVESSLSVKTIESENFVDFLSAMMNDENDFRNSRRDLVKSISKDAFLFCFLISASFNSWIFFLCVIIFFWSGAIFLRRRFLSSFVVKQHSCVLMIIWKIFFCFSFSCSQFFTHSRTASRSWCSFWKWNRTYLKSVFIQCFSCC